MFLIPLLIIFLFSIFGGILFSILLMNMGMMDIPPEYKWLRKYLLFKKDE